MPEIRKISPPFWHPAQSKAFILDWDGVLADTRLDFKPLRAKYFGGKIVPLIEAAEALGSPLGDEVRAEIRAVEMEGAERAVPVGGAPELIRWLNASGRPWAVVSRNCRESILLAAERCNIKLPSVVLSREDPYVKPEPEALALAARKLGVDLRSCAMVGDFIYDLLGARRAAVRAILVGQGQEDWARLADIAYPTVADLVISLAAPEPLVPWEYHDLVKNQGVAYLASVARQRYRLPLNDAFRLALELASLGVLHMGVDEKAKMDVDSWKDSFLPPQAIDMPLLPLLQDVVAHRWPYVTIEEAGAHPLPDSIEVPAVFGEELRRFLISSLK